ncbi:MAG TPA: SOS response-associated peptidase [Candidatus Limnocylindria bacterium]|nr:SOS response-associated peptidase [Candidatus Limnocylindria bacterium]
MCGRFTLFDSADSVGERFGLPETPSLSPRYNIAPSQTVAAVRIPPGGGARELVFLRWGLVPSWAKDPAIGNRMINARAETAADKPAFRVAIRRRRCLVPADGFYEWKRVNGRKQPYYIRLRDVAVFAFAGLWESWEGPGGASVESCALLTTGPNDLLLPIHDRMPVILSPRDYELWLSPKEQDPKALAPLLRPYPPEEMTVFPVGIAVNNPKTDTPDLIEPLR